MTLFFVSNNKFAKDVEMYLNEYPKKYEDYEIVEVISQQRIIEKFEKGEFNFKRLKLTSSWLVHFNSKHLIYTFGGYDDRVYGFMAALMLRS